MLEEFNTMSADRIAPEQEMQIEWPVVIDHGPLVVPGEGQRLRRKAKAYLQFILTTELSRATAGWAQ